MYSKNQGQAWTVSKTAGQLATHCHYILRTLFPFSCYTFCEYSHLIALHFTTHTSTVLQQNWSWAANMTLFRNISSSVHVIIAAYICGEPTMCCALWEIRIMMIITSKFPMIRNDTSSRSYLNMFSTVGVVWHAEEDASRWAPRILHGDCLHNRFVCAGEAAGQENCVSGPIAN